jgi:epoxyqueuosine reductase
VSPVELNLRIKALASSLGFQRCGIAEARSVRRADYVRVWLNSGRAGTMTYLQRNVELRLDPRQLLPGANSVIVTAMVYRQEPCATEQPASTGPFGRVAMYAWGEDYHTVIRERLHEMVAALRREISVPFEARVCVDTAPVLERAWAEEAGVGWIGKNTLVMHEDLGSYLFLGSIVTTLDASPDPQAENRCGTCTACLEACPTSALPVPYQMDAARCISYLTIEHRGPIDPELAEKQGVWIFGCDLCQEVCPFNRHSPLTQEPRFSIRAPGPRIPVEEVLSWTGPEHRRVTRGSATGRATEAMWKRNADIVSLNSLRDSRESEP